ncbi:MAG: alkaline phosphatase family protein, partial [Steroidobacteraceae bacterium]
MVAVAIVAALGWAFGCGRAPNADRRVIVLGIDGMDYGVVRDLMAAGRMPNFSTLAERGGFVPLATTNPPQSPVAWSSFITGEDPGQYGIYDFIHRDPATMLPFLSTTRTTPGRTLTIGSRRIPITSGHVEMLRGGAPFWSALTKRGIEATIVR